MRKKAEDSLFVVVDHIEANPFKKKRLEALRDKIANSHRGPRLDEIVWEPFLRPVIPYDEQDNQP